MTGSITAFYPQQVEGGCYPRYYSIIARSEMKHILLYSPLAFVIFMITSCAQVYQPLAYDHELKPSVNFQIWLTEPDTGIYVPFESTIINYERVQPDPLQLNGTAFFLRLEYRAPNNFEARRIIDHWSRTGNLVKVQYQP